MAPSRINTPITCRREKLLPRKVTESTVPQINIDENMTCALLASKFSKPLKYSTLPIADETTMSDATGQWLARPVKDIPPSKGLSINAKNAPDPVRSTASVIADTLTLLLMTLVATPKAALAKTDARVRYNHFIY